jgi:Holliday junction resolvase RusA-like endonuclease
VLQITVDGEPRAKGSITAIVVHGVARMIQGGSAKSHKKIREWMEQVTWEARRKMRMLGQEMLADCPVDVTYHFVMKRGKTVKRKLPSVTPDLDKLVRCIDDALEGVVYKNDSQITSMRAGKTYGEQPRVEIEIRAE